MERKTREFTAGDQAWRAVEAWRAGSGHGLLYFLPLTDEPPSGGRAPGRADEGPWPAEDDRRDRRALLAPGDSLEGLEADGLRERLEEGAPLTETERRFADGEGRQWLAQDVGPVWADGGVAEGLTGVLFTSLEGELERVRTDGGALAGRAAAELAELLAAARRGDGEDGPSADGGG